jgi:hypothetical protein
MTLCATDRLWILQHRAQWWDRIRVGSFFVFFFYFLLFFLLLSNPLFILLGLSAPTYPLFFPRFQDFKKHYTTSCVTDRLWILWHRAQRRDQIRVGLFFYYLFFFFVFLLFFYYYLTFYLFF